MCESATCYNNGNGEIGYCTKSPVTNGTTPFACETSNDCSGTNSKGELFYGECTCGYNPTGQSYCSVFPADSPGLEWVTRAKELYQSKGMKFCQTTRRHSKNCMRIVAATQGENATYYYGAYLGYHFFPLIQDNEDCVKDTFTLEYWENKHDPNPAPECKTYTCEPLFGDLCFSPHDENYELEICSADKPYCDYKALNQSAYCMEWPWPANNTKYPGDPCYGDSNCISGICLSGKCKGSLQGFSCSENSHCDVGLFCNSLGKCQQQLAEGETCKDDFECQNMYACNATSRQSGMCVKYFSFEVGETVNDCMGFKTPEGFSNLCETGSCKKIPGPSTIGICTLQYELDGPYPHTCDRNEDCIATDSENKTLMGSCECGMNKDGFSFCNTFSGDEPSQVTRSQLKLHFGNSGIGNCHTTQRLSEWCMSQNIPFHYAYDYFRNEYLKIDTPRYRDNEKCTAQIINYDYSSLTLEKFRCKKYGCGQVDSGVCIGFNSTGNMFEIGQCDQNEYCDYEYATDNPYLKVECSSQEPKNQAYPGEICTSDSECVYGNCVLGKCEGKAKFDKCSKSEECNVGLYCRQGICNSLRRADETCSNDYDCVPNTFCLLNSGSGTCKPYFSMKLNQEVPCPKSGFSYYCETGTCFNPGNSTTGYCAKAPTSKSFAKECLISDDCSASNEDGENFPGECMCGFNSEGQSYCAAHAADEPGVKYLDYAKQFMTGDHIKTCQTTRRYSKNCLVVVAVLSGKEHFTYYNAFLNFTSYPLYIGNDDCTKETFTSEYWNTIPNPTPEPQCPTYTCSDSLGDQ
eukprot:CAMPEP_0202428950 /NCGR_PEP_ID=MMETSP1345-20130828/2835_1 /ASSEMBLY_ACC=CAM_ASM_000843 /TAXON_ID=342563 /ORGANISM="Fabrea Fabrea salina" /LENGTH=801 /DNA_ID=CAMNT_0049040067 /DNA_START=230 /DNA_END=2632 /DNA_ORIENTATION=+